MPQFLRPRKSSVELVEVHTCSTRITVFVSKVGFQSFVHPEWTHRHIENHPILGAPALLQRVFTFRCPVISTILFHKARVTPSEAKEASLMGDFNSRSLYGLYGNLMDLYGMICRSFELNISILNFEQRQDISLRPSIQVAKELSRTRATNCLRETWSAWGCGEYLHRWVMNVSMNQCAL